MKHWIRRPALFLLAACLLAGVSVYAVGAGSAEDPLLTLSYLEQRLKPQLEQEYSELTRQAVEDVEQRMAAELNGAFIPEVLEAGDEFVCQPGTEFLLREGSLHLTGQVLDVTAGSIPEEGEALPLNHLYMVLEELTMSPAEPQEGEVQPVTLLLRGEYDPEAPIVVIPEE